MTKSTHLYETTCEFYFGDTVTGSIELCFTYTYAPGTSDYYDRYIGGWLPGESTEVEIIKVEEERMNPKTLKPEWVLVEGDYPNGENRHDAFVEWAYQKHYEDMLEEAETALRGG